MSEWFGTLPKEWEALKINSLFSERREKVSDTDFAPLSVSKGGVVPQIATVAKSNAGDNRKLVRIGDFAINSRSDRKGSSGISAYDGSVSLINIVLTPRDETNGKYWHYLLKCYNFIEEYYRNGRGIVADLWTTRYDEMKSIYLPLPPRTEQDQIVRYLDWKVSGINRLINAKKKQIALLGEQKRAVINEAVTRGTWETRRLKTFVTESKETVGDKSAEHELLSLTKSGVIVRDVSSGKGKFPSDFSTYKIVKSGQIIFCLFDVDETPRTVGLSYNDGMITGAYDVFSINGIVPRFLECFFIAIDDVKGLKPLYTGLRKVVSIDKFLQVQIPTPPLEEQQNIIADLDRKCRSIDDLIEKISAEISLLGEYKTRLISDVVTGKKDVSGIVVPEYELVEENASDVSANEEETEQEEE